MVNSRDIPYRCKGYSISYTCVFNNTKTLLSFHGFLYYFLKSFLHEYYIANILLDLNSFSEYVCDPLTMKVVAFKL